MEEHRREVHEDLRRHDLALTQQAATDHHVGLEVPLLADAHRAPPAEHGASVAVQRPDLAEDLSQQRGPTLPGDREACGQGADRHRHISQLLGEVRGEPVQVEPMGALREALQGHAHGPLDEVVGDLALALSAQVEDAVDRDREQVVAFGGRGQVLEATRRFHLAAGLAHQVRHQQVRVDTIRVAAEPLGVALERPLVQPSQLEDPGLELVGDAAVRCCCAQLRELLDRLSAASALQPTQRQLAHMLDPVFGVALDQLLDQLLVFAVVLTREVDRGLATDQVHVGDPLAPQRLLGDLGRRGRVADLDVEPHQQFDIGGVGGARVEPVLELDRDLGKHPQPRRDRHHPVFDVTPARRAADLAPERAPDGERVFFTVDLRQQQRVLHVEVGPEGAAVGGPHAVEHRDGAVQPVDPLVDPRDLAQHAVAAVGPLLELIEHGRRLLEPAAVDVQLDDEHLGRAAQRVADGRAARPRFGQVVEAELHQRKGSVELGLGIFATVAEAGPHAGGAVTVAVLQVLPAEAAAPLQVGGLGSDQLLKLGDQDLLAAGLTADL